MNLNALRIWASHFYVPRKILLVMKITTLLLLITVMTVSATTFAQKITLNEHKASLEQVLEKIRIQSGYDLIYSDDMLSKSTSVTINLKDASLDEALKASLQNQPLTYQIQDGTVVFRVKELTFIDKVKEIIAAIDVSGRVTDENNQPLASATVTVKGTNNSTLTDANGFFTLKGVQPNEAIVISFIGYEKQELPAKANLGGIKLTQATSPLDEVKVQAYGTTSQRLSTGNISSVSAKEIEQQPVANPLLALEGRAPGVFITQSTGLPGSGVNVLIQGKNSLTKGNDPLYVIDGVPYSSQLLPTINAILGSSSKNGAPAATGGGNPLSFINPNDIESISLLKDADATSIYGSRAANGAILITTKKGKVGATKVDFNLQNGWGQVAHFLPVLNSQQYLQMRHQAFKNDGLTPDPNSDYDLFNHYGWDTTRNTNWQKELIGRTARYGDYNISISGGSATTQFLIGGNLHRETTVFPGDLADNKGGVHFSLNNSSTNQRFHFQLTGSYMADNNQLSSTDFTTDAVQLPPVAPTLNNPDGSLNWGSMPNGNSTWKNDLAYLRNTYGNKTNNLVSNLLMSYQILPGLDFTTSAGYTNLTTNEIATYPIAANLPEYRSIFKGSSIFANSQIISWVIEPQIHYTRNISKGKLDLLVGSTVQQNNNYRQQFSASNYPTDAQLQDIRSAPNVTVASTVNSVYKYNAGFSRINYNWEDKYIVNLTGRRDGSSRFGPESQFHNFWSVAGAWLFSNEDFFKKAVPFLSFGKIRASYGTTGNDQIGDYSFLNLYNNVTANVPYQGVNGLAPGGIYNPFLQWEETKKLQFGLDLGFLKDRILIYTGFARNRSSNELLSYDLPVITGFTSLAANFPATIQNTAWEYTVSTNNIKSKDFSWTTSINLTIPQNKLLSFPNLATSGYANSLVIGQPFTILKKYHYLGVDPASGQYEFANWVGGQTTNPDTAVLKNRTSLVNLAPKFYGGFQNTFHYKAFEIGVFFQFVKQTGPNYAFGNTPGRFFGTSNFGNQPTYILDYWRQTGDINTFGKLSTTYPGTQRSNYSAVPNSSDAAYSDASYIRLKNASLSWQLPEVWKKSVHFQNANIYVQGQNLLTFTHYKGLDPESLSSTTLPPLRVWTIGVRVGL